MSGKGMAPRCLTTCSYKAANENKDTSKVYQISLGLDLFSSPVWWIETCSVPVI